VARLSSDYGEVRTQSQQDDRGIGEAVAEAPGGTPVEKGTERQCRAECRQSNETATGWFKLIVMVGWGKTTKITEAGKQAEAKYQQQRG
jgi:hypothetical protein